MMHVSPGNLLQVLYLMQRPPLVAHCHSTDNASTRLAVRLFTLFFLSLRCSVCFHSGQISNSPVPFARGQIREKREPRHPFTSVPSQKSENLLLSSQSKPAFISLHPSVLICLSACFVIRLLFRCDFRDSKILVVLSVVDSYFTCQVCACLRPSSSPQMWTARLRSAFSQRLDVKPGCFCFSKTLKRPSSGRDGSLRPLTSADVISASRRITSDHRLMFESFSVCFVCFDINSVIIKKW